MEAHNVPESSEIVCWQSLQQMQHELIDSDGQIPMSPIVAYLSVWLVEFVKHSVTFQCLIIRTAVKVEYHSIPVGCFATPVEYRYGFDMLDIANIGVDV